MGPMIKIACSPTKSTEYSRGRITSCRSGAAICLPRYTLNALPLGLTSRASPPDAGVVQQPAGEAQEADGVRKYHKFQRDGPPDVLSVGAVLVHVPRLLRPRLQLLLAVTRWAATVFVVITVIMRKITSRRMMFAFIVVSVL